MNKALIYILGLFIVTTGCDLFNNDPEPKLPSLESISLRASDLYTTTNSQIPIEIQIEARLDNNVRTVVREFELYINNEITTKSALFSSDVPGTYSLYIESKGIRSDTLQIEVREPVQYEPKEFNIIFHIVHDGEEIGEGYNISQDQIDYQMSLLAAVFENPDLNFTTNSTHPAMFFKLANVDPEGNPMPEPGINRVQRPSQDHSILFEDWMWDYYWDPDYYINVWIGDTKNGFSWGIYPETWCNSNITALACTDADVPSTIQGIALNLPNLWEGNWVFPHEMGHIFGLFHVFGPDNCMYDPDFVNDTPYYDRDKYELKIAQNNAGDIYREPCDNLNLLDFVSVNVMDYHHQTGLGRDLTYDQVERMRYVVERGRFRASKDPETGTPRVLTKTKVVSRSEQLKKSVN